MVSGGPEGGVDSMYAELLAQIDGFLAGSMAVRSLEDWLLSHLQQIIDSGDVAAKELADAVDVALMGHGDGDIDAVGLRLRLDLLVTEAMTVATDIPLVAWTTRGETQSDDSVAKLDMTLVPMRDYRWEMAFS